MAVADAASCISPRSPRPQQQDDERAEADSVSETSSSGSGDDTAERDQAARHAERDERLDWMTLAFYLRLIQY